MRWTGATGRQQTELMTGRGLFGCSCTCSQLRLRLSGRDVVLFRWHRAWMVANLCRPSPGLVSIFLQATPALRRWAKLFRRAAAGLFSQGKPRRRKPTARAKAAGGGARATWNKEVEGRGVTLHSIAKSKAADRSVRSTRVVRHATIRSTRSIRSIRGAHLCGAATALFGLETIHPVGFRFLLPTFIARVRK